MTVYAHTANSTPSRLPSQWKDPATGKTHYMLAALDDAGLAALGWYPVRYEDLELGASGFGDIYLDTVAGEWVVPSLPADPAVAEQQRIDSMTVTALQGMLAIHSAGLAAEFNAWKASLDPISDFATIAFFEKAQTWRRDNHYLIQGATALGLTDAQLDELFALAATL